MPQTIPMAGRRITWRATTTARLIRLTAGIALLALTTMATKGVGINGPTRGYSGVQGTSNFDGNADVDINGFEIGLLGVSTGAVTLIQRLGSALNLCRVVGNSLD